MKFKKSAKCSGQSLIPWIPTTQTRSRLHGFSKSRCWRSKEGAQAHRDGPPTPASKRGFFAENVPFGFLMSAYCANYITMTGLLLLRRQRKDPLGRKTTPSCAIRKESVALQQQPECISGQGMSPPWRQDLV